MSESSDPVTVEWETTSRFRVTLPAAVWRRFTTGTQLYPMLGALEDADPESIPVDTSRRLIRATVNGKSVSVREEVTG